MSETDETLGEEDIESRDGWTRKRTEFNDNPRLELKPREERGRRWYPISDS
jgi:hypothetical protein